MESRRWGHSPGPAERWRLHVVLNASPPLSADHPWRVAWPDAAVPEMEVCFLFETDATGRADAWARPHECFWCELLPSPAEEVRIRTSGWPALNAAGYERADPIRYQTAPTNLREATMVGFDSAVWWLDVALIANGRPACVSFSATNEGLVPCATGGSDFATDLVSRVIAKYRDREIFHWHDLRTAQVADLVGIPPF